MTRERMYLTPELRDQIAGVVREGGTVADAIDMLGLAQSTVYRWLQRAREGNGTRAMVALLEAVRAAEAGHERPAVRFREGVRDDRRRDLAELERRVRILEACVRELTGIDLEPVAAVAS